MTQTLSIGMEKLKPVLFPLIAEILRADGHEISGIFERNDVKIRELEGLAQGKGWFGDEHPGSCVTEICENGVYYSVDVENGQKTGFVSPWLALQRARGCSTASRTPARLR